MSAPGPLASWALGSNVSAGCASRVSCRLHLVCAAAATAVSVTVCGVRMRLPSGAKALAPHQLEWFLANQYTIIISPALTLAKLARPSSLGPAAAPSVA
eukprot:2718786-Prymnesium_polylepis.1